MTIEEILLGAIKREASDIHLTVGRPVTYRMIGSLVSVGEKALTRLDTEALAKEVTTEVQRKKIQEVGGIDFGFSFRDEARFRVSCFKQQGQYSLVLRLLPARFYSFQDIGLPAQLIETLSLPRGLVLVTGPTGSGKTTTLATMLNFINENFPKHIITAEDPVEFMHRHKQGVVTQREVGEDVPSFSEAIVKSLRQDPDVILIGEMRDRETITAALTAAETGHLVFGTLHTNSAPSTINRIIDVFNGDEQPQVRAQLSTSLVAVISQALLPKIGGGRLAAQEIMITNPAIANLVREDKVHQIYSQMQLNQQATGMTTQTQELFEYLRKKLISKDTAIQYSNKPDELMRVIESM